MTYPTSTDVIAGQATAAAHYNNLRNDALYLGNPITDSDLLANLLAAYQSGLTLQYLATNKVRVPASTTAPVRLMVGGVMLSATANVDLAAAPSGGAMIYYVFAVRTAGSTTFTLAINSSPTESATTRLIGQFYWTSATITLLQSKQRLESLAQTYSENSQVCQGRLSLAGATPVTTADVLTASMVYFTPYQGNYISLWEVGVGWHTLYFTELSLSIAGYTANKNYDIFIYNNNGTPAIESLVWTSDTVRATLISYLDGRYVKTGDFTRLYVGTFRTTSVTGQTEDSVLKRFVWNYFNRVPRSMKFRDGTTSWTYGSSTYRQMNGAAANKVEFVIGICEDMVTAMNYGSAWVDTIGDEARVSIGLDAINAVAADASVPLVNLVATTLGIVVPLVSVYRGYPVYGYHYLAAIEACMAGTNVFYGVLTMFTAEVRA